MKFAQISRSSRRAFTLIEILLAMAILGAVLTAVYATWISVLRATRIGTEAAVEAHRVRMTRQILRDAITGLVYFELNQAFYSFETDTSGDFSAMSCVARLPATFPGSALFAGQPLRRVTFEVRNVQNGVGQLTVSQAPVVYELEEEDAGYTLPLMGGIHKFTLEFWDEEIQDWAMEWTLTNRVPKAIRYEMEYGGDGRLFSGTHVGDVIALGGSSISRQDQIPN